MQQIEPICSNDQCDVNEECTKCGLSRNTNVLHDSEKFMDELIVHQWIQNKISHIKDKLQVFLQFTAPQWNQSKRKYVLVSYYDDIYSLVHDVDMQFIPADVLMENKTIKEEMKHSQVVKKLQHYSADTLIFWIRVAQPDPKQQEKSDDDDDSNNDDDSKPSLSSSQPSYDVCVRITPQDVLSSRKAEAKQQLDNIEKIIAIYQTKLEEQPQDSETTTEKSYYQNKIAEYKTLAQEYHQLFFASPS